MISERDQDAVAQMVYGTYAFGLWPIGTFLSGLEGFGLLWPTIAAVPLYLFEYFSDRRRQADKEAPSTRINSVIIVAIMIFTAMFVVYFLAFAINYFLN